MQLLGTEPQQLGEETTPCRQITVRAHYGNADASIGHVDVTTAKRWAFVLEGETYTIGPFPPGNGIRPCDIYILGSLGDEFTWGGFHS
jgi:hypothetical protein